ncbi:activator of middle period transcription [Acinetobacter phage vB_AbaM_PhT2]|uniref:Activator of middle period transcription n=2 Tax=Hadassahvirus TaxID=2842716 RepID=A0A6B9SXT1_9CAUD|nr:MotA-like activator of middle period transcription [Acinetobacter phage AbTZA1]YP_009887107.1 MotA-like activator of middle period transcription [Acinetobacter phage vB_AbaM_PhT2]AZU98606.1 activator of middle period transcription [Acinetobacter phage AbTZA1]QHJ75699.1 activator of middle period transcription [Acinetobacter phage vB_AbaM_PhT2]UQS94324.1 activator of middle period transcription [Acinetobacter phage AB-Navy71]
MDKLFYMAQAAKQLNLDKTPGDQALNCLLKLYGTQYHSKDEIGEHLDELIEFNLVDESNEMYIISIFGDELVENAMKLFVEAERPDLLVKRTGSNKREITEDMESCRDHAVEYIKGKIEIKDVSVSRSNIFLFFEKRCKGIGCIEIKNKPEIRVCIRKPSQETIDLFASIGMSYRSTPAQTYFDMPRTIENIEILIDTIVNYFNS